MSCCYSVPKSCSTRCDPVDCSMPGLPVHHQFLEFIQTQTTNRLILCHSLLLPPSVFPSIRVFSNESALCIRWTEYWSSSFSISPSNEYSGLISFRIDWFDILAVQKTLKSSPAPQFKSINSLALSLINGSTLKTDVEAETQILWQPDAKS